MTFNYPLMELLCQELSQRTKHSLVISCYPKDVKRFYLILERNTNHREALYFCFIPPFLRFHLSTLSTLPHQETLHPLHRFLEGAILQESALLQHDRILELTFHTAQGIRLLIAEFFTKHPNYYLIKPDGTILFSLYSLGRTHYKLPAPSQYLSSASSLWFSHKEVEEAYQKLEMQWEFTKEKKILHNEYNRQLIKLQNKKQNLLKDLTLCNEWMKIQHEGELIKSHFSSLKKGMSVIILHDWLTNQPYQLTLDPIKTPQAEMASRFKKAKKLQASIAPITQFLNRIENQLIRLKEKLEQIEQASTLKELSAFKNDQSPTSRKQQTHPKNLPSSIYREYISASGMKIWVGKNARANDCLTFQLANGRDWWLHIRECPGSHVIIRVAKEQEPDSETLKDAMQLALYHSKARTQQEGEICFTQRKYVSKLGRAGLVQISKHQTAWIRFNPKRYQALLERLKPTL